MVIFVYREEEERNMMAAIQDSLSIRHQEERGHYERGSQKPRKEEKMDTDELKGNRGVVKPSSDMQGKEFTLFCLLAV